MKILFYEIGDNLCVKIRVKGTLCFVWNFLSKVGAGNHLSRS